MEKSDLERARDIVNARRLYSLTGEEATKAVWEGISVGRKLGQQEIIEKLEAIMRETK